MEDSQIIELYWNREESAISHTASKYGAYCGAIARRILENEQDTEECVSDSWLRAWNAMPPARPSCLRTFLGRITRNLALDRFDRETAQKRGGGQVLLALEELRELSGPDDPQKAIDAKELAEAINEYIGSLDPGVRREFVRRYWYLESIKEVAQAEGFSESKVKSDLFRARAGLREALTKKGF